MKKIIVIGCDHNGTQQKYEIIKHLKKKSFTVIDLGNYNEKIKTDYNDVAQQLGNIVNQDLKKNIGILICGTGVGVNIVVNKATCTFQITELNAWWLKVSNDLGIGNLSDNSVYL